MSSLRYIKVILPLRLGWEPYYSTDLPVKPGDRVRVVLARKRYVGVVYQTGVTPDVDAEKILPIEGVAEAFPSITSNELKFWDFLSSYYLCTLGEIYHAAYPDSRIKSEETAARKVLKKGIPDVKPLCQSPNHNAPVTPTVIISPNRFPYYVQEARMTLKEGRGVLFLVPETSLGDNLQEKMKTEFGSELLVYSSRQTPVQRRKTADKLRDVTSPELLIGTRSALFLPFRDLGLIIIDEEQELSYKQIEPNPRYHARDAAIVLGLIHGAKVVLGSSCPSFETEINIRNGKYVLGENQRLPLRATIIDVNKEKQKNGMIGAFSRKLIEEINNSESVVLVRGWERQEELDAAVNELFHGKNIIVQSSSTALNDLEKVDLIAVLQADAFFRREDFRSDERVVQLLYRLSSRSNKLVVQTAKSGHPVFRADADAIVALLEERKAFNLPPYERIADICISDSNPGRLAKMAFHLSKVLPVSAQRITVDNGVKFRLTIPRGSAATAMKLKIQGEMFKLEREMNYRSHFYSDIDPQ